MGAVAFGCDSLLWGFRTGISSMDYVLKGAEVHNAQVEKAYIDALISDAQSILTNQQMMFEKLMTEVVTLGVAMTDSSHSSSSEEGNKAETDDADVFRFE